METLPWVFGEYEPGRPLGISPAAEMVHEAVRSGRLPSIDECRRLSREARAERDEEDAKRQSLVRRFEAAPRRSRAHRRSAMAATAAPPPNALDDLEEAALLAYLRRANAELEIRQQARCRREASRPTAEWKRDPTRWERFGIQKAFSASVATGSLRGYRDERHRGAQLGDQHGRNPWQVAAALHLDVSMDARGDRHDPPAFYDTRTREISIDPDHGYVEAIVSLAHEIGHHQLGHTGGLGDRHQSEQEAWAFAAGLLFGISEEDW